MESVSTKIYKSNYFILSMKKKRKEKGKEKKLNHHHSTRRYQKEYLSSIKLGENNLSQSDISPHL